jgi:aspartate/methionine/tyrosine aminotransferase
MFSSRTRWDLRPNRLSTLLVEKRRRGARVLDLTESNPTRVGLRVPDDLLAPLGSASGGLYEPAPLGLASARKAVARDFARRGFPVDADRLVLTASTSEAYAFLFKLLCDPGDEIVVPRPGYPLFDYLASLESVRTAGYPLEHDGRWRVDLEALQAALSPRTRAVVIVSPGNPSGAYLHDQERRALVELAAERDLALISDEVFADFSLQRGARPSLARDDRALVFTLGGLSKSCALPQVKLAWAAVTGPERARREALDRLEVIADTALSVSTPVQLAAPKLLGRLEELQAPLMARLQSNLRALRARMPPNSPVSLLEPEGGWSVVLRVPATVACHGVRGGARRPSPRGPRRPRSPGRPLRLPPGRPPGVEPPAAPGGVRGGCGPGPPRPRNIAGRRFLPSQCT